MESSLNSVPAHPGRSPRLRPLTPVLGAVVAVAKKGKKRKERAPPPSQEQIGEELGEKISRKEAKLAKLAKRAARDPERKRKEQKADDDEVKSLAESHDGFFGDIVERSGSTDSFLAENEIVIHDENAPPPCIALSEAPFPALLVKLLTEQPGFTKPSGVQGASWPVAVQGRDILAIAKTGSGKTLGYLLPALAKCHQLKSLSNGYPICLIMSPTRELALQIQAQAEKFGRSLGCRSCAVYGGASKWGQTKQLQAGIEVVVATPGRMLDMLDLHGEGWGAPATSLDKCAILVLDEADRMLDMGFEKDIRTIVGVMKATRQTLFYTATWPKNVQRVAADILKPDKVKVTVGSGGDKLTANKSVTQRVLVVEQRDKWDAFLKLMESFKTGGADEGKRVMIFCNTKKDVNAISEHFWGQEYPIDSLSGDRTQRDREMVIQKFRNGAVTMVVATDVAARGLDIDGIERVINYDFPRDAADDYIHRIGRTGRAGATGDADTLFTRGDSRYARELVRILSDAEQEVPEELSALVGKGGGKGRSKGKGKGKGKGGSKGKGGKGRW